MSRLAKVRIVCMDVLAVLHVVHQMLGQSTHQYRKRMTTLMRLRLVLLYGQITFQIVFATRLRELQNGLGLILRSEVDLIHHIGSARLFCGIGMVEC